MGVVCILATALSTCGRQLRTRAPLTQCVGTSTSSYVSVKNIGILLRVISEIDSHNLLEFSRFLVCNSNVVILAALSLDIRSLSVRIRAATSTLIFERD